MKKHAIIVFSDLDGTLLDENYSFEAAEHALQTLAANDIPLILCSSKTRSEIELYRKRLDNRHPFISENGGGIFIPENYFPHDPPGVRSRLRREDGYLVISLGTPYERLRQALDRLRREGFRVTGFGDLPVEEVARRTSLPREEALLCMRRDFDEPFFFDGDAEDEEKLSASVRAMGLNMTRGVFRHILGDNDKGKAVDILAGVYRSLYGEITTIALGDSPNDLPMLKRVDYAVAVRRPDGGHHPSLDLPGLARADGVGPEGWRQSVLSLLAERPWMKRNIED